ncbi:hypothetical protein [Denitratisoma oestradiolicum]|uniref:Apea-like HEPN domain-containing protein n=1 Tax=Denitratisoma oestradiolicum TaxID=311182 RepID=A0A6S6XW06_9PROT|nr:hypothetical protein [Denitratisoma oestradiolicum]TWO80378.1 hypothetical protein CBW56_09735 [Denitratisoma oestradiolicum]CAB1370179.1 conserved protein of unknown function [Denitratisoma oestradiolicum]
MSDPIDVFSSYWRGFNNLFSSVGQGQERDLIKSYLGVNISPEQAQEVLDKNATEIDYLLSQPVIDMRGNGKDTLPNIDAFQGAADTKAKLSELFMVIYQVRCNLEHGQKSPTSDRDVRLCACAAPIVSYVLERNA